MIFAFEEESRTRDFSIHRLAHYCLDLSELLQLDSIVPVVIVLQKSRRAKKELLLGTGNTTFLGFRYLYCSLAELNYLDWRESNNRVAVLNLPCMHYKKSEKLAMYHYTTKQFFKLEKRRKLLEKYIDFIDYYAKFTDKDFEVFEQQYPQEGKVMKTFSQRHMEAGMQKGELSSLINTLLMLLETRFGQVPQPIDQKVKQAETEQLNQWIKNTLTADTLESVFV